MMRIVMAALLFLATLGVAGAAPIEGVDYRRIEPPVPVSTPPGTVEVIDVFWYGCPHCYRFKPALDKWIASKPEGVKIVRLPGVLGPSWRVHALAYYAAESFGIAEKLHGPLFDAIHAQGRRLFRDASIARFVESLSLGVTADQFLERMNSPTIRDKAAKAEALMRSYRIEGTPSVIVAGKYVVTTGKTENFPEMMATIEALVAAERKGGLH